jgi:hypothetical protein
MGSWKPTLLEQIKPMWFIRLLPQGGRKEIPMLINGKSVKSVLHMLRDFGVDERVRLYIVAGPLQGISIVFLRGARAEREQGACLVPLDQ